MVRMQSGSAIRRRPAGPPFAALLAAVMVVLAGCGSPDPATPPSTSGSAAASASASVSPTSVAVPTVTSQSSGPGPTAATSRPSSISAATGASTPDGVVVRLTGTIERGVEKGCVVLVATGGAVRANLIGLDTASAPFGSSVVVTGKFESAMMTTCMQGSPFVVAKVELR